MFEAFRGRTGGSVASRVSGPRPRSAEAAAQLRRFDHPFWRLVGLRALFLVLTGFTLLWEPLRRGQIPAERAYNGLTDLMFGAFDKWDSGNFLHIAQHGYDADWTPAYFPVYPALLYAGHFVFGSYLVAGVLISLVAAGFAAWALAEIARPLLGEHGARDSVLYLALFPTAFVFTALYSDGLFLALSAAAFLAALRNRPWAAAAAGALAVGTRSMGVALIVPLVYLLCPRRRRDLWRPLPALVALPAALGGYALYLHSHRGDALAFEHAQWFWNRSRPSLGPLGGLKQAVTEGLNGGDLVIRHLPRGLNAPAGFDANYQWAFWNAAHLVLLVVGVALTIVAWRRLGTAFGLYSAAILLLVLTEPATSFALVSLPRFLMDDFPVVLALAAITTRYPRTRTSVVAALAALTAVAGIAFARGAWIA
jgi:hypothetical protein